MHGFIENMKRVPFISTQKEWHGLGVIKESISFEDALNTTQVKEWKAIKVQNHDDLGNPIAGSYNLTRVSTIGVEEGNKYILCPYVRSKYEIIQYDTLFEWLRPFIEEGQIKIETAGVLENGKRFFLLVDTGYEREVAPSDKVRHYLLFALSHGRERFAATTSIRVCCTNTLSQVNRLSHEEKSFRLEISSQMSINEAHQFFQRSQGLFIGTSYKFEGFEELSLTKNQVHSLLCRILNLPETEEKANMPEVYHHFMYYYLNGTGMEKFYSDERDTGFRLLNAITEGLKTQKQSDLANFKNVYSYRGLKRIANQYLTKQVQYSLPKLYEDWQRVGILGIV